jgi:hypothetical protein
MKKHLNFKNIAIAVLVVIVLLEFFNPFGNMPGRTIRVNGKKYEVIKHTVDTIDVIKTKVVTKKGEDIYHETIKEVVIPTIVDTTAILQNYYSKVVYKDVLVLPDSLGTVAVTDTITQNKIAFRTFDAKVKQRTIKETTIVKELPKTQVFLGFNGGFNKKDVISNVGAGVVVKTKKEKLYQIGIGVTNNVTDGTNGSLSPFINAGIFWKIKLGK